MDTVTTKHEVQALVIRVRELEHRMATYEQEAVLMREHIQALMLKEALTRRLLAEMMTPR